MVIIEGTGTLSVTEPGHDRGTYYEKAEIRVYGEVVHFVAYNKHHTAATTMCRTSGSRRRASSESTAGMNFSQTYCMACAEGCTRSSA